MAKCHGIKEKNEFKNEINLFLMNLKMEDLKAIKNRFDFEGLNARVVEVEKHRDSDIGEPFRFKFGNNHFVYSTSWRVII